MESIGCGGSRQEPDFHHLALTKDNLLSSIQNYSSFNPTVVFGLFHQIEDLKLNYPKEAGLASDCVELSLEFQSLVERALSELESTFHSLYQKINQVYDMFHLFFAMLRSQIFTLQSSIVEDYLPIFFLQTNK